MKRELLISFLPPVLLCVAIRLALAVAIVFRPDVFPSIGAAQEWALVLTALAGVPALIVFAGARLWIARAKIKNLGAIFASVSLSAAIMWIGSGEPYWRLLSKKAEYDAFAATHPLDEVIVFDWGEAPGPIPFDRYKEYLVIARGSRVKTFEAYTGQVIGSWGDDRSEVDGMLSAAWPENDRYRRFGTAKFDACNMRIVHLTGHYYYAVDFC